MAQQKQRETERESASSDALMEFGLRWGTRGGLKIDPWNEVAAAERRSFCFLASPSHFSWLAAPLDRPLPCHVTRPCSGGPARLRGGPVPAGWLAGSCEARKASSLTPNRSWDTAALPGERGRLFFGSPAPPLRAGGTKNSMPSPYGRAAVSQLRLGVRDKARKGRPGSLWGKW